jgi:FtsH-binding integral membrane protein
MFSTAGLARATGALPRWLVWLTYGLGVVELVNVTFATPTIYLVPAWIGLVSVVLLIRRPRRAFQLSQPSSAP